jgi:hypothetical protein
MFFVKRPSVTPDEIPPPAAKPRLTERLKRDWLLAVGIGPALAFRGVASSDPYIRRYRDSGEAFNKNGISTTNFARHGLPRIHRSPLRRRWFRLSQFPRCLLRPAQFAEALPAGGTAL